MANVTVDAEFLAQLLELAARAVRSVARQADEPPAVEDNGEDKE